MKANLYVSAPEFGLDRSGTWKMRKLAVVKGADWDEVKRRAARIADKDCGGLEADPWWNEDNNAELYAQPDRRSVQRGYILRGSGR